jgi:hypothetical protein
MISRETHPFRVRKQSSGYSNSVGWIVIKLPASRVSVHAFHSREAAFMAADDHNISHQVRPHAEDPRPYHDRLNEAIAAYEKLPR